MNSLCLGTFKRLLLCGGFAILYCTASLAANEPPREHWSFQPPRSPVSPAVNGKAWPHQPIDAFVLSHLERAKIVPSPPAPSTTLVRRVFLDLVGLPPDPEIVDKFAQDARPDAWERLVDRALASVHFGERWGRHWLDQARYADSDGYANDHPRSIWAYRDWVIGALNDDMPFDQFTVEQIAGDLLEDASLSQRIATGFHRNTLINKEGGSNAEQFRVESVVDRVNTTGQVWLGLTIACAQCHDHKYDPLTQREFYELFAFFNQTEDNNTKEPIVGVTPESTAELDAITTQLAAARQRKLTDRVKELEARLKQVKQQTTMVMRDRAERRKTNILVRGDFLRPGEPVEAAVPNILPPLSPRSEGPHTRLDLAHWLVDARNPLTARVTVNRVWLRMFGRGLVQTEEDFGTRATPPTHPMLLDWLAVEFVRGDWSMKRLLRLVLTSSTYRQSSRSRPELSAIDPTNRLLARQTRIRLEAEIVRDLMLGSSGQLTRTIGGPSVYPQQRDDVYNFTRGQQAWPTSTGADRFRRTLYTYFYRSAPYPFLTTFDVPRFNHSCTRRPRSNTPLQSLTMANNAALFEMVRALASRVVRDVPPGDSDGDQKRIERAFQLCLARKPTADEGLHLKQFLDRSRLRFAVATDGAASISSESTPDGIHAREAASWTALTRVLVNLDEFITRE